MVKLSQTSYQSRERVMLRMLESHSIIRNTFHIHVEFVNLIKFSLKAMIKLIIWNISLSFNVKSQQVPSFILQKMFMLYWN